jgi:hypothetical protein
MIMSEVFSGHRCWEQKMALGPGSRAKVGGRCDQVANWVRALLKIASADGIMDGLMVPLATDSPSWHGAGP